MLGFKRLEVFCGLFFLCVLFFPPLAVLGIEPRAVGVLRDWSTNGATPQAWAFQKLFTSELQLHLQPSENLSLSLPSALGL